MRKLSAPAQQAAPNPVNTANPGNPTPLTGFSTAVGQDIPGSNELANEVGPCWRHRILGSTQSTTMPHLARYSRQEIAVDLYL